MALSKTKDAKGKATLNTLIKEKFPSKIMESRKSQGTIEDFAFNKSRCRILTDNKKLADKTKGILYWMIRDCRVQDNWAMLYAQKLALKHKLPLMVCFSLYEAHCRYPTRRHQEFLLEGLKLVKNQCEALNIDFLLMNDSPKNLAKIVDKIDIGGVVCDFSPLREPQDWIQTLKKHLPSHVPLIQVDAHNVVPAWVASDKVEHMARTIRPKILKKLSEYLTGYPEVRKHPYRSKVDLATVNLEKALELMEVKWDVSPVAEVKPGEQHGFEMLHSFMNQGLKFYGVSSNDPSKNHTSNLSFWLNFGHISAQRVALEIKSLEPLYKEQVEKYLEELIVRRELAENFCFYNENYDKIEGAANWAKETLKLHATDKRVYTYTKAQLENAQSHDEMWNAAQIQLKKEGKVHGYMRMYWAKKVLEWTESPQQGLEYALWLNDTFALDGNDPNGFVGVMWSICGIHDQGWREREIFGKIRFMVDYSLRKKYDMDAFCARYGIKGKGSQQGKKRKLSKR